MKIAVTVRARRVVGFFSGDTIIARECWGSSLLGRLWLKTVFYETDRIHRSVARHAGLLVPDLFRLQDVALFAVFFRDYLAAPGNPAASRFDREVLPALAAKKFGDRYDPRTGIVHSITQILCGRASPK